MKGKIMAMRPRARKALVAVVGTVALLLTACTPVVPTDGGVALEENFGSEVDPETAQEGGELIFGLSAEGDGLDPTVSTSLTNQHIFSAMCTSLYVYTDDSFVEPRLAADLPDISADETVYTIPLREDALFSDGTPMTASAVVDTLHRNLEDSESQRRSELGPIESIEATGEHQVTITLDEPYAPLLPALADRPGMVQNPAVPAEEFASEPSCVAPFRFVERVANTSVTLEKDPNYFGANDVHLDRIVYRIMPDANVLAANLESGDIHTTDKVSPQDVTSLMDSDSVEVISSENVGYQGLHINLDESTSANPELANNVEVRRALSLAIDRESLARVASNGVWSGACGPIADSSAYATQNSQACPEHDPDEARRIMESAGVETPFTVVLTVPNQQDPLRYAQALQSSVQDAGFSIQVRTTEYATVLSDVATGDFDAVLLGWGGRSDPDGNMRMYWSSDGSTNYASYANPDVDALMKAATGTTDVDDRAAAYGEAITLINADLPYVFTHRIRNLAGANGVEGVRMNVVGIMDPSFAAFTD